MKKINQLKHIEILKKTILGTAIIMTLLGCSGGGGSSVKTPSIHVTETGTAGMECQFPGDEIRNDGIIVVEADLAAGMLSEFDNSIIINNGEITVNENLSFGIVVAGANSIATNEGTINVNQSYSMGMYATSGATVINNGAINLNDYYGIGISGEGTGTTIENHGTINLSGTEVMPGYSTDEYAPISDEFILNGVDSKGNVGMAIRDGARMINSGQIIFGK